MRKHRLEDRMTVPVLFYFQLSQAKVRRLSDKWFVSEGWHRYIFGPLLSAFAQPLTALKIGN